MPKTRSKRPKRPYFYRAVFVGETSIEISTDLPNSVINSIKKTYKELCDQNLLRKCLYGKAQNCNESLNNVVWSIIPKDNFVEQQTLLLRNYIAIILFNFRFAGLLPLLQKLGLKLCPEMKGYFWYFDETRIVDSTRHSKLDKKLSRKKRKALQNSKSLKRFIRQLPPVHSTPVYKQPKQTPSLERFYGEIKKFYELNEIMRQANQQFSSILTKIGNGKQLDEMKIALIESRFCTVKEAEARCPQGAKNVELSVIPINLLSILNFLKLNPKNLVGLMNHGGGSVPAWGCKSAS
ncbi:uncharacterized protein TNCV_1276191 [Trichonephila clavipes]|nr:uncharacterized protein TNCV_1276191 [Trichonephila clavipes]